MDTSIPLRNADDSAAEQSPVRNGNRWRVTAINPDNNRLVARRLDDNTLAAFSGDYLREHITHGYAVTVHSAQRHRRRRRQRNRHPRAALRRHFTRP